MLHRGPPPSDLKAGRVEAPLITAAAPPRCPNDLRLTAPTMSTNGNENPSPKKRRSTYRPTDPNVEELTSTRISNSAQRQVFIGLVDRVGRWHSSWKLKGPLTFIRARRAAKRPKDSGSDGSGVATRPPFGSGRGRSPVQHSSRTNID